MMELRSIKTFASAALLVIAASCNTTKHVPANDALYMGPKVTVKGPDGKKSKTLARELKALSRPKPNARVLGIPFKLIIYNLGLKKMGEPPVLLSDVRVQHNALIMENYLENNGYFNAAVSGDSVVKNKKGTARFDASSGHQYKIRDVVFRDDSSAITRYIDTIKTKSLLKKGEAYDLDAIVAERIRVDAALKEKGFYYFNPDFLLADVDSTIGNNEVNIYMHIKQETPPAAKRRYSINEVNIYPNYSLNITESDTSKANATFYEGYYVYDPEKLFKPKLFEQAMQFAPGDIYNRTEHNLTLNRLMNLGIFKFVKNRFEISKNDTTLDTYYYLTPMPRNSLSAEIGGNTKSNNMTGSQINLRYTNRNAFRAGEILTVTAFVGSEVQVSGTFKGFNTYRVGAEANLAIPRFVVPFIEVNPRGGFVPRTNIQLGYEVLNRQNLYTLNSFKGAYGYIWKENIKKEHTFYPISIQYVNPVKITQLYLDSLSDDPTLQKAVDTQFILGANYNYTYNGIFGQQFPDGLYFNGLLDVSGNIAGAIKGGNAKQGEFARLFNTPFSQYLKLETDLRFYKRVSRSNVWANRLIVGAGFPYGNSIELPFIKQFFVGGNNSIRAFRSRSLGPGTYLPQDYGKNSFIPDQSGDIKLEINSEFRFKIVSPVYGAVFVDAGNIWLRNENPLKPGAKFSKDFLKELAVGTGVGVRVDISILVLRLDVAFPIRKPWLADKERWVLGDVNFGDTDWRRENVIYNLAIGYPF